MREPAQKIGIGTAAFIAARPKPGKVRWQHAAATLAALADNQQRTALRALHQHLGLAWADIDDAEPMTPGWLLARCAGEVAGHGMFFAEFGERRFERLLDHAAGRH